MEARREANALLLNICSAQTQGWGTDNRRCTSIRGIAELSGSRGQTQRVQTRTYRGPDSASQAKWVCADPQPPLGPPTRSPSPSNLQGIAKTRRSEAECFAMCPQSPKVARARGSGARLPARVLGHDSHYVRTQVQEGVDGVHEIPIYVPWCALSAEA